MSIDYDRLRELLEQWEHGDEVHDRLQARWDMELAAPDLARELLRLRDGIEVIRDYCAGATTARRSSGDPATEVIARELGAVDRTLADLLNGDTE